MTDPIARFLLALVVIAGPMLLAWRMSRPRRARVGDMPADMGPFPGIFLFSSRSCPTCEPARELIGRVVGDQMRELAWPAETVSFHKLGVGVVPSTYVVDPRGKVTELFRGVPEERRLRKAVLKAGLTPR